MISLIIPTYNEELVIEHCIQHILKRKKESEIEIIVVDGGSTDNTVLLSQQYCTVIQSVQGKSAQLNAGARRAKGDILFFLHADATLPKGALQAIRTKVYKEKYDGGGFSNIFSSFNNKIKILGRLLNVRFKDNDTPGNLSFFGDNGIFVRTSVFNRLGGFPDIPIMEDYEFSVRLKDEYRSVRIKEPLLIVSPRRHLKEGYVVTRFKWIFIKQLHLMGISPRLLSRLYTNIR